MVARIERVGGTNGRCLVPNPKIISTPEELQEIAEYVRRMTGPWVAERILETIRDLWAKPVEAQKVDEALRRRIHQREGQNQWFERCESAWCHPSPDNDPARDAAISANKSTPDGSRKENERGE